MDVTIEWAPAPVGSRRRFHPLVALAAALSLATGARAQDHHQQPPAAPAERPAEHAGHAMEPAAERPRDPALPELGGDPISLSELEARTKEHNPEVAQATAAVRAAEGLRRQVTLPPDPTVGLVIEELGIESGGGEGKIGGFLSQTVVLGGKLRLNRAIFGREVERARAAHDLAVLRELNRVRALYYRTLVMQRRVQSRERVSALTLEAVAVTEQLYNTGSADLPDALAVEIEADEADLALGDARRDLDELWHQLRAAVGDPDLPRRPLLDGLEEDLPALEREDVLQRIKSESPEVRFALLGIERAELAARRERAEPVPDLEVTAGLLDDREPSTPDRLDAGLELFGEIALRIPVFNRGRGNIAAADAEIDRAREELRKTLLKIESRFAPAFADYERHLERAVRYRDRILVRAEQAHQLYRDRYEQMAAAYPQVLQAQRTWLEAEEAYIDSLGKLREAAVLLDGMLLMDEVTPALLEDSVLRRTPLEIAE
jgi:cobalt-zinc-cadmium efflux system outer membrane protein